VPASLGNTFYQANDRAPERCVVDTHKGLEQSQAIGAGKKVVDVCRGRRFRESPVLAGRSRSLIKEEGNRDVENMAHVLQATCTDAICPFFVFLHLLEREAQLTGKLFLAHAEYKATHADAATDMFVGRMGVFGRQIDILISGRE